MIPSRKGSTMIGKDLNKSFRGELALILHDHKLDLDDQAVRIIARKLTDRALEIFKEKDGSADRWGSLLFRQAEELAELASETADVRNRLALIEAIESLAKRAGIAEAEPESPREREKRIARRGVELRHDQLEDDQFDEDEFTDPGVMVRTEPSDPKPVKRREIESPPRAPRRRSNG